MKNFHALLVAACFAICCALGLVAGLTGCTSTVTPSRVTPTQAGFDGNSQDSGYVVKPTGAEFTPTARARYNGLIATYGKKFTPALTVDYGVTALTDGNFSMTKEALQDFIIMSQWRDMGGSAQ